MKQWWLGITLILLVLMNGTCELTTETHKYKCNLNGLTDKQMEEAVITTTCSDPNISEMIITDSKIEKMPQIFDQYLNLRVVNMTNCGIQDFPLHPFTNATYLTTFIFNGQNVKRLPEHLFLGATNIIILNLANSSIEVLNSRSFVPLKFIYTINLSNNRIRGLPDGIFDSQLMLTNIRLSHNHIEIISNNLFRLNTILENVHLESNDLIHIEQYAFHGTALNILILSNNTNLNELNIQADTFGNIIKVDVSSTNLKRFVVPVTAKVVLASNSSIQTIEGGPTFRHVSAPYQVEHMDFCRNKLTSLTQFEPFSKLAVLDVSQNEVTQIDYDALGHLSNLRELNVAFNPISDKNLNIKRLNQMENLVSLTISRYQFENLNIAGLKTVHVQILGDEHSTLPPRLLPTPYDPLMSTTVAPLSTTPSYPTYIKKMMQNEDIRYKNIIKQLDSTNEALEDIQQELFETHVIALIVVSITFCGCLFVTVFRGPFECCEKNRQRAKNVWQWLRGKRAEEAPSTQTLAKTPKSKDNIADDGAHKDTPSECSNENRPLITNDRTSIIRSMLQRITAFFVMTDNAEGGSSKIGN